MSQEAPLSPKVFLTAAAPDDDADAATAAASARGPAAAAAYVDAAAVDFAAFASGFGRLHYFSSECRRHPLHP